MTEKVEYWVKVPIGPIHPGLEEPEKFILTLDGERIINVDVKLGYNLRGIQWISYRRNYVQMMYLVERICGICSFSHNHTYSRAVEEAAGIEVPERAEYIRAIVGELERIHSHLLNIGVIGHDIGYDTVLHLTWLAREKVMDVLEAISGNRVNYSMVTIGGVRRDIDDKGKRLILDLIKYYRSIMPQIEEVFLHDPTIEARLRDTAVISRRIAREYGAVGPTARGSGLKVDARWSEGLGVYPDLGVKPVLPQDVTGEKPHGDVYDRTAVRIGEIHQSLELLEHALDQMPDGKIKAFPKDNVLVAKLKIMVDGEGVGRYEAPRGELVHYVRGKRGSDKPLRWKAREPTFPNIFTIAKGLVGNQVADVVVAIASIDPCLSCTDRVAVIQDGKRKVLTERDLIKASIEKTREINPDVKGDPSPLGVGCAR
ncbi:MAG: nickel-dependent hydrogenase large subunit [Thermococcus sp.]|uniref:Hydrogenase n=1 Tax=Thermococcus guaymasensis DSM 11113 TaxID=1432656 RepID=A0A0X1KJP9_9EURY|nr:nickel-dependent hydrogenase large subunit [Thermococcus guaymasensis]AJC71467.1 hydrogenase [Thermococcus guaymasensis DSM 11113]MCD6523492.1 nickel-dependent hydrogenase large subunit [Thermococcus sp.]